MKFASKIYTFINTKCMSAIDACLLSFLSIFLFLLPFENIVVFNGVTILKIVAIPVCVFAFFKIVFGGDKIRIRISLFSITFWILLFLVSGIYTVSKPWFLFYAKSYIQLFVLFLFVVNVRFDKKTIIVLLLTFFFSCLTASFVVLFSSPSFPEMYGTESRKTIELFGTYLDNNYLAAILELGIIFSAVLSISSYSKNKAISVLFALFGCFMVIAALMTGSRTFFLVMGLSAAIVFGYFLIFKKNKWLTLLITVSIVSVAVIVYMRLPSAIRDRYSLSSLFGDSDAGGGRMAIWKDIINTYGFNKSITGYGGGSSFYLTNFIYGKDVAFHNTYLSCFYENGIFGLISLVSVFTVDIVKSIKRRNLMALLLIVSIATTSFFLDVFPTKFFWVYLISFELLIDFCSSSESKPFFIKKWVETSW